MSFLNQLPAAAKKAVEQDGPKQPTLPCVVRSEGSKVTVTWDFAQIDGTPNTGHIRHTSKAKAPYVTLDAPDSATVVIDGTPISITFQGMRTNGYLRRAGAAGQ